MKSSAAGSNSSNSNSNSNDDALSSSWITRLYPQPQSLPFSNLPAISPPTARSGAAPPPEVAAGFGPFRAAPRAVGSVGGGGGGEEEETELGGRLRTAGELIRAHGSAAHREIGMASSRRRGSESSLDGADGQASSRNSANHRAFGPNIVQHLQQRQNPSFVSEPEEPFSYWNMGKLRERNFVSSVPPVTSWTMPHAKKRAAVTYGFSPLKSRKFHTED